VVSAAELNRLLEEGLVSPEAWERIGRLDATFLGRFELDEAELQALQVPDPPSLAAIGVHPMLAMWAAFMRVPEFSRQMSAGEYFAGFSEAER